MVHEITNRTTLPPEHKTLINYWFRHIWEFSWPLYPGVILTCALSGIDLWTFVLVQFPLTLFTAWVGYLTQLRSIPFQDHTLASNSKKPLAGFLKELMPILLVVGGAVFFGVLIYLVGKAWTPLKSAGKEIPLIAALIISVFWVWRYNRMKVGHIQGIFLNRSLLSMIYMIAGVMVFQGLLEDSRAVSEISQNLTSAHVPIILVIVVLPFLVGSITGITVAFVGTTFPIIFSLLADTGMADQLRAYTVLAFCAGYLGVLLSPLHICLVLTCAYFKAGLTKVYGKLWLPCAAVAAAGVLSFWINQLI
jgi:integral membrane protein (TIGR00529 family)